MTADFTTKTISIQKKPHWGISFKMQKENNGHFRILYLVRISFRKKDSIRKKELLKVAQHKNKYFT